MTDVELFDRDYLTSLPSSFRVIGIGEATKEIIETVKSYGYDCVSATVITAPFECVPTDEDKMAIIVTKDDVDAANKIAKTYHDADVLTIGLVPDADYSCYDSVATDAKNMDFSETIINLLLPLVTNGYICYDFNDLCTILKKSHSFSTLITNGKDVEESVANMQNKMENIAIHDIESLSAHIFFNRERRSNIKMEDMVHLSNMISNLPESINVIWSVNFDDSLPEDQIRFTIIMSGKKL